MPQVDYYISAKIVEKDIIKVDFIEKETISAKFTSVDILKYLQTVTNLIQEVPTKLSATKFSTAKKFISGSLQIYFNGLKMRIGDITEISDKIFEISDATISADVIEVLYVEKN